jgi:glutaredoxin
VNIILYTKKGCPWCAGALKLLNDNKINFEEREVLGNPNYFKELVDKSGQTKTPTMEIDGVIVAADSDADAISVILKERGILKK